MSLEELLTSPQVAKRLGVTRQRVDQLVELGQLPAPMGVAGRNRLWRASDIELAAASRDESTGRSAAPDWDRVLAPDTPLRLDVDAVLTIPGVSYDDEPQVHVRIWRGPVGGTRRTVVLYGALVESHGIIVNWAETVARTIAAQHLTVGEARSAWWFGFWPRGFPRRVLSIDYVSFAFPRADDSGGSGGLLDTLLRRGSRDAWTGEFENPIWQPMERTDLARILGTEPDLDYPPDTYTAAVVTDLAAGQRPAVIDFDPLQLDARLRHLTSLHGYRQALLSGGHDHPDLPAFGLLAQGGHAPAARTAEALAIAVRALTPDAVVAVEDYQRMTTEDLGTVLVERRLRRPSTAEQALLDTYTGLSEDQLSAGAVYRALTEVRTLTSTLAEQTATRGPHQDPTLTEALAAAEPELVSIRHLLDPALIDDPGPSLHAISTLGDAEKAYLATVSWWGPAAGDTHRAVALRDHVWQKDRDDLRTGYDPFGRLVLHNPTTDALAVERPRALPATAYPDGAEILATPRAMTAFVRLPDGRCDILPTDPRYTYDDITWGYGGTGPETLAQALSFAVLPHPDPKRPLALEDRPRVTQDYLLDLTSEPSPPQNDPLRLSVGDLRAAVSDQSA
ncbi:hypothetical protein [Streptomyces sp. Isolate_45]|uniref:helix-turn-helix transcriptional regulator n=1 Tax=Streptomyces sp. Isolate_45 TaxID=2950111 RepID=UPI002481D87A|nr:hypothetical protein [Streptomyces sp. Isolate_45]MDA5279911.1 hypothetical protein [Streptomyces sp. Isolate_45]